MRFLSPLFGSADSAAMAIDFRGGDALSAPKRCHPYTAPIRTNPTASATVSPLISASAAPSRAARSSQLHNTAHAEGNQQVARLAVRILEHAATEEQVLYPAALLVSDFIGATGPDRR